MEVKHSKNDKERKQLERMNLKEQQTKLMMKERRHKGGKRSRQTKLYNRRKRIEM